MVFAACIAAINSHERSIKKLCRVKAKALKTAQVQDGYPGLREQTTGLGTDERRWRAGLRGKISIVPGRRACFMNCKDGLSAICMSEEIPPGVTNGEMVRFDAVPSFDKKKNRESWRAKNIQKANYGTE